MITNSVKLIEPQSDIEITVCNKAIISYRWQINRIQKEKEYLDSMKFQLSDIVMKQETCGLDSIFGVGSGNIGKIVGWDFENNYYRVFYSKANSYIGVEECQLEKYDGQVPDEVINHDPFEIDIMLLRF